MLRTDGGKGFQAVDLLCQRIGIRRQKAEPYNQASNGKAERMIRNILEFARSMLLASNLPLVFWGDAVLYANYIIIRIPTSANVNRLLPFEVAYKKTPYLGDLVPFGAKCTVMVSHKYGKKKKHDETSNTWKPRGLEGRIVGKNEEVKCYRVYIPKTQEVVTSQHVRNIEGLTPDENAKIQEILYPDDAEAGDSTVGARIPEGDGRVRLETRPPDDEVVEIVKNSTSKKSTGGNPEPAVSASKDNHEKKSGSKGNKKKKRVDSSTGIVTRSQTKGNQVNNVTEQDPRSYRRG